MRKGVLALLLIVSVGVGMAFAIDPNDLNKVTFQNNTGTKIEMIFLSPADSDHRRGLHLEGRREHFLLCPLS